MPNDEIDEDDVISTSMAPTSQSFYGQRHNLSGTSIDSENLLDHRYIIAHAPLSASSPLVNTS